MGNDTYVVDNRPDVITENVGEGTDLVNVAFTAAGTYILSANIENATVTGTVAGINITGNAGANLLTGSALANTLDGATATTPWRRGRQRQPHGGDGNDRSTAEKATICYLLGERNRQVAGERREYDARRQWQRLLTSSILKDTVIETSASVASRRSLPLRCGRIRCILRFYNLVIDRTSASSAFDYLLGTGNRSPIISLGKSGGDIFFGLGGSDTLMAARAMTG